MAKQARGSRLNRSAKNKSENKAALGNLTYLDMFPYNPSYEFQGFRSAFGAFCSILFLFAVLLNIASQIIEFEHSPPMIRETLLKLSDYTNSRTIPVPQIAIEFRKDGYLPFYDDHYFRIQFLQGFSFRADVPSISDAGIKDCEVADPEGFITFKSLKCPASDMSMQGSDNLEYFRFVKIRIEQCVNWTKWNDDDRYIPDRGSTVESLAPELCADADEIEDILQKGVFTLYFTESDMRTDRQKYFTFEWVSKISSTVLSIGHVTKTVTVRLKHLTTTERYVLDEKQVDPVFLTVIKTHDAITDTEQVIEPCGGESLCNLDKYPHMYRMAYILRLDNVFLRQIRSSPELFKMFASFGGVTFFFLIVIGGTATLMNKRIFRKQTQGLDLRKLDRSQFDKFGNLVDKSFQMPRELQDMSAE